MPPFQTNLLTDDVSPVENDLDLNGQNLRDNDKGEKYTDDLSDDLECDLSSTDESMPVCHTTSPLVPFMRRVHFADTDDVFPTLCLNDYTSIEYYSVWYSPHEDFERKRRRERILYHMQSGTLSQSDQQKEITYRGLESLTLEGSQKVHRNTRQVLDAVMNEQERQRRLGFWNPDEIASTSMALTSASIKQARDTGREDEEELQEREVVENATPVLVQSDPRRRRRRSWSILKFFVKQSSDARSIQTSSSSP